MMRSTPRLRNGQNRRATVGRPQYDAPMRKWLARLAFSFLVIAFACGWEAYRGNHPRTKQVLLVCGAAIGAGLGLAGLRERQRMYRDQRWGE